MRIPHMGVGSAWHVLKQLYAFCHSETPLVQSAQAAPIPRAHLSIYALPSNPYIVLAQLLAGSATTSIATEEIVDAIKTRCLISQAKARSLVTRSPLVIPIGGDLLHAAGADCEQADFNYLVGCSKFENFLTLLTTALTAASGERNANIVLARYGFHENALSLQSLADRHGLTRERVRQIVDQTMRKVMKQERLWRLLSLPLNQTLQACGNVCRARVLAETLERNYSAVWHGMSGAGYIGLLGDMDSALHIYRRGEDKIVCREPVSALAAKAFGVLAKAFLAAADGPVADDVLAQHIGQWWEEVMPGSQPPFDNATDLLFLMGELQRVGNMWFLPERQGEVLPAKVDPLPAQKTSVDLRRSGVLHTKAEQVRIILQEHGSPMHFNVIAEQHQVRFGGITTQQFRSILASKPATFVCVGQKTYGLVEWGLAAPRWIGDIMVDFLTACGKPMSEEEIRQAVRKEQKASATAIAMTLIFVQHKKASFHRFGTKWGLACWRTDRTVTAQDG